MAKDIKVGDWGGIGMGGISRRANRAVNKVVSKAGEKGATKAGFEAAKKTAETTKAAKYPSAAGKKVNMKVEGSATTTSKTGSKSTVSNAKKIEATKKAPTEKQRLGIAQANEKKRVKKIVESGATTKSASQKVIGKEVVKKNVYKAVAVGLAAKEVADKKKGKK